MQVRPERSGWRDEGLSQRHRDWGWDCPAIDLDCVFLEYDRGSVSALVEYKHEQAKAEDFNHPSYRALIDLGNRSGVPVLNVRYAGDFSWWLVTALNDHAKRWAARPVTITEPEYVAMISRIRGFEVSAADTATMIAQLRHERAIRAPKVRGAIDYPFWT